MTGAEGGQWKAQSLKHRGAAGDTGGQASGWNRPAMGRPPALFAAAASAAIAETAPCHVIAAEAAPTGERTGKEALARIAEIRRGAGRHRHADRLRSEEHMSELQSRPHL